jgi:aerobic-type carbon monoxide dehydrogenase small subunit (CoxS/CutS family)
MEITLSINSKRHTVEISPSETLLDLVRRLGYTSVKFGCGEGACGACTVILDGRPVNSCLVLAATAGGREVVTLEALGDTRRPHALQEAFIEAGAIQCGFCTPGMILSAQALLDKNPDPSEDEIREAIDGNLCRCTGYVQIIEAVRLAAKRLKKVGAKSSRRAQTGSR